jgi:Spy/CpxP family protein refolding chaperone
MVKGPKLKAYALLAIAFVLGVVVGGGIFFAYAERRHAGLLDEDRRGAMEGRRLRALSRRLDLSPDQEAKIRAIVTEQRQAGATLANEMLERCGEALRRHHDEIEHEIRAVLRPEQQARYDELMKRRGHRFFLGPGLPPPSAP